MKSLIQHHTEDERVLQASSKCNCRFECKVHTNFVTSLFQCCLQFQKQFIAR